MRPTFIVSVLAITSSLVFAQPTEIQRSGSVEQRDVRGVPIKHAHRSHAHAANKAGSPKKMKKRDGKNKRCKASSSSSSVSLAAATATKSATGTHTKAASSATASSSSSSSGGGTADVVNGMLHVTDPKCGANNPSPSPVKGGGPNGAESWFNCGIEKSGWTPPFLDYTKILYTPLADIMSKSGNVYSSCKPYLSIFQSVAKKYNLPDTLLAAIAMQESSCNPKAFSAGSHGLFQLSQDLCNGQGGDCYDPENNTDGGAKYLAGLLKSHNNNFLPAMGEYNGWYNGITPSKVSSQPCAERQNFNYHQNILNGWLFGGDGYNNGDVNYGCNGADNA